MSRVCRIYEGFPIRRLGSVRVTEQECKFTAPAEAGGADRERCGGAQSGEPFEDPGLSDGRAVEEEEREEVASHCKSGEPGMENIEF